MLTDRELAIYSLGKTEGVNSIAETLGKGFDDEKYIESIQMANKADKDNREEARKLIQKAADEKLIPVETNDKDYVFIHFILNNLPRGLIGLLLAVILCAAMSSTAGELNALASTTALDLYKRNHKREENEMHYVKATKWFTLGWGILAIGIACIAYLADNLIQLVNIIGSIFYGNVLGIFLLAFFFKNIGSRPVFTSAIITQILIFILYYFGIFRLEQMGEKPLLSYLWLNLVGCILIMYLAFIHVFKGFKIVSKLLFLLISVNIFKIIYDIIDVRNTSLIYILSLLFLFILIGLFNYQKNTNISLKNE